MILPFPCWIKTAFPAGFASLFLWIALAAAPAAANDGGEVFIVYNRRMAESKDVADYYAEKRRVPRDQILGLELPATDTLTREEFRDELQKPLLKALENKKMFTYQGDITSANRSRAGSVRYRLVSSRIRYLVLTYGVPVRIVRDLNLVEKGEDEVQPELRRNEAAVDSELALLPLAKQGYPLFGPWKNHFIGITNASLIHPTNVVLMVARLDGPTASIAKGLVDKAMETETNGLWGRAYFDARGLTNTSYKMGDDWIRQASIACHRFGFDTYLDEKPESFPPSYPMSQIALYAGWYEQNVSGPFSRPHVEFMPGAIAYHLHSYSGFAIRNDSIHWVGPLLKQGATATFGYVDEPYLGGTVDLSVFFPRLLSGFTFGEAVYAAQSALSWQTTVVGDPLYRPFGLPPQKLHGDLLRRHSPLLAWSHVRVVNINSVMGTPPKELIGYLRRLPDLDQSAVLLEKLAELYDKNSQTIEAFGAYQKALKTSPTSLQKLRILQRLADHLKITGDKDALEKVLQQMAEEFPDYRT